MFCSKCGHRLEDEPKFCSNCGKGILLHSHRSASSGGRFGCVQSFVDFKNSRGKPSKAALEKGEKTEASNVKEVVIKIGLMAWDSSEVKLKERRAKCVALRVSALANYETLLENAIEKWKNFWRNLFQEGKKYTLLLEDGQEAKFLPGSNQEGFLLNRYKEELMKDYKRITLYLCTVDDFCYSEGLCSNQSEEEMLSIFEDKENVKNLSDGEGPSGSSSWNPSQIGKIQKESQVCINDSDNEDFPDFTSKHQEKNADKVNAQIKSDENFAFLLQEEFETELEKEDTELAKLSGKAYTDESQVILSLEKKVIADGRDSVFIVIRRKAQLERKLQLWKRATRKLPPENVLHVKFLGEEGIDTGALAKEFLTEVISEIGAKFFPDGSPHHSTNDIHSGNFKVCGELVSVSLAQGGPPPCFLDEKVYETLCTNLEDVDFTSSTLVEQLTIKEKELLDQIRKDVFNNQDTIIDHGFTGYIHQDNVESIIASVVVSVMSRRILCLKEFRKGLNLFGRTDMIRQYPKVTHKLFVFGQQEPVDANYLLSLLKPHFSEEGSNRRADEEAMMDHLQDFLIKTEDEPLNAGAEAIAWADKGNNEPDDNCNDADGKVLEYKSEEVSKQDISPAGVLGWLTGVKHRELGSACRLIQVLFDHDCLNRNPSHSICFPIVSACARALTLPIVHMKTQECFKKVFLTAVSNSQAFGMK